jgi:small conductance mechanosensitive channel
VLDQVDPEAQRLLEVCGDAPSFVCREVFDRTGSERWADAVDILFGKPLTILLVVAIAWVVHRLVDRVILRFQRTMSGEQPPARRLKRHLRQTPLGRALPDTMLATGGYSPRRAARAETLGAVLRSLAGFCIWTIAAITILGELGVNLAPLIASAGIAGLAVGFGAQTLVRDFVAGMFILIEDQYGVGDVLDVGELSGTPVAGTVEAVSLRSTRLRGVDGTVWYVPNGQVLRVGNKSQDWGRAVLDVMVGPTADLRQAQQVVKDAADAMWRDPAWSRRMLNEPELIGVEAVTAEGVTIQLVAQTAPDARLPVIRELRGRARQALAEAGVPLPHAQRMVVAEPAAAAAKAPARRAATPRRRA